jgi:hypothetical protein
MNDEVDEALLEILEIILHDAFESQGGKVDFHEQFLPRRPLQQQSAHRTPGIMFQQVAKRSNSPSQLRGRGGLCRNVTQYTSLSA